MKIVILVVATISTVSFCWTKTEILSDELIIHQPETDDQGGSSKQKVHRAFKFQFSAEDVLSCGTDCGDGCDGDYPLDAWIYWKNWDIVSGGDYKSQQGCQPYTRSAFVNHINKINTSVPTSTPSPKMFKKFRPKSSPKDPSKPNI
ncbi:hypothetical protein MTP99_018285 [Tenebrio molitor]|nr:hypothetical protein MTP99_018285 [Tenebrio molitor]